MSSEERRLDGNAIGGLLLELFGVELTVAPSVCGSCGSLEPVARLQVYADAPGIVVRCCHCEDVMMRIVRAPGRAWIDLSGTGSIEVQGLD